MIAIKKFLLVIFFLLTVFGISAQVVIPVFGAQELLNGYEKTLSGETIPYFSVYPDYAKEALLTRCTNGKKSIEWETSPIPKDYKGKYVYFSWIAAHSTGSNNGIRNFDLYINDQYVLTFTTYPKNYPAYWTFGSKDSTRLVFELKTKDGAMDAHGFAYLRVPVSKYEKGKPLKIKITGRHENSNDWYMTFQYTFTEKIDVESPPFILKNGMQPVIFTVLHFGAPQKLLIQINRHEQKSVTVKNGINSFEIPMAAVKKDSTLKIHAAIGKLLTSTRELDVHPVIKREIYLIHGSHNDIGYSNTQEDVVKIQNKNISDALRLIQKTKDYPEGSRFVWNVESLWAVENFLNSSASAKEKKDFFSAVRNNQVGLGALYANILTGLCTPEEMEWIVEYADIIRNRYHLPVNTAMMSDIPGLSWSMVHALAHNHIRYFSNGPNHSESMPDHGDRIGYTLKAAGDKPFWWKSPSGKDSILFWTAGKGYSSWHGFPPGGVKERGPKKIESYLNQLDDTGYPYSMVQWRYYIGADNGPVDSTISDFVRSWNKKYLSPKLILSSVNNMFEAFENKYGHTVPVLLGDFTPYWDDGAYSTAKEEGENRILSEKIIQLEKAAKQLHKTIGSAALYRDKRDIVMFHEHTWGSWNSISDPDNPFTIHQWDYKKAFLDSAKYYTRKIENTLFPQVTHPMSVVVINTLPWARAGYVEMPSPPLFRGNTLIDGNGNKIKIERISNSKIGFITDIIPAKGKVIYHFSEENNTLPVLFQSPVTCSIDSATGAIAHLSTLEHDWVNSASPFKGLGEAVYVKGLNPDHYSLTTVKKIETTEDNPWVKRERITCSLEGADEVQYDITQFRNEDRLHITVSIDKRAVREKESVHIAFPFTISNPVVRIGTGDTCYTPESGQLPGANKDFYSVQRWLDVSNQNIGVTISSPQGALFEVGSMIDERKINHGYKLWKTRNKSSSAIFLYAMNNYWHTNYKADQEGKVQFDFILQFHKAFNFHNAYNFGMEATQPLLSYCQ